MRNRLAWVAGALGAAGVAYKTLRNRPSALAEPAADPRADELRRKLDESKPIIDEREEFEAGETPVDETESLDDKRAAVHARARAAADEMRPATPEE
jgi:hypothetical protein